MNKIEPNKPSDRKSPEKTEIEKRPKWEDDVPQFRLIKKNKK